MANRSVFGSPCLVGRPAAAQVQTGQFDEIRSMPVCRHHGKHQAKLEIAQSSGQLEIDERITIRGGVSMINVAFRQQLKKRVFLRGG